MPRISYVLFLIIIVACLSSCASGGGYSDIVQQQFFTDIKSDDSKLFIYIVNFKKAHARTQDDVVNHPGTDNTAKQRSMQKQHQRSQRAIEEKLSDALRQKIKSTGYCREGFFILSQYIEFGSGEIRGECRESANATDRALFSK